MWLRRESAIWNDADTNFVGDRHGLGAYSRPVGAEVKRVDGGVMAMTDTLTNAALGVLGTLISVCLGWAFSISSRVSVVENQQKNLADWLERVEEKLDRVIERRR